MFCGYYSTDNNILLLRKNLKYVVVASWDEAYHLYILKRWFFFGYARKC